MPSAIRYSAMLAAFALGAGCAGAISANYDNLGFQMTMERGCGEAAAPAQGATGSIKANLKAFGIPIVVFENWKGETASLLIRYTASGDGKVTDAATIKTDKNGETYAAGLVETVRTWTFSPGDTGTHCIDVWIGNLDEAAVERAAPNKRLGTPSAATAVPLPEAAKAAGVAGAVELSVWITNLGTVRKATVLSESPAGYGIANAAIKAVTESWRFAGTAPGWYRLSVNVAN